MTTLSFSVIFGQTMSPPVVAETLKWKAVALAAGLALGVLSYPVHGAPASGGDTVKGPSVSAETLGWLLARHPGPTGSGYAHGPIR
jgi:hypothetical protein